MKIIQLNKIITTQQCKKSYMKRVEAGIKGYNSIPVSVLPHFFLKQKGLTLIYQQIHSIKSYTMYCLFIALKMLNRINLLSEVLQILFGLQQGKRDWTVKYTGTFQVLLFIG